MKLTQMGPGKVYYSHYHNCDAWYQVVYAVRDRHTLVVLQSSNPNSVPYGYPWTQSWWDSGHFPAQPVQFECHG